MTLQSFFKPPAGLTVREIVALTGAVPCGGARLDRVISGIAALDRARPSDIVFMDSAKHVKALAATQAGACLTTERFAGELPAALPVLRSEQPFRDFVMVARRLYPEALRPTSLFDGDAVGPGATVHSTAAIEYGVTIDPGAVVGPRAGIGSGTTIGPNAVIGPDVQIGRDAYIGPGATIVHALIGDKVIIHAGCHIGQDGFRYHPAHGSHVKVPQLGRVIIQDHVEIGAGSAIDRGGIGDTVIGEGTKIDNLVQIGHNCIVGRHCIIVSQCGLSGSVVLGDYVMLGGQVGIADHLTIGEDTRIGAQSGVASNVPGGQTWIGTPAMVSNDFYRLVLEFKRLVKRGRPKAP